MSNDRDCYIYVMHSKELGLVKIGISDAPWERKRQLQCGSADEIVLHAALRVPNREIAQAIEQSFHTVRRSDRVRGEWFKRDPDESALDIAMSIATYLKHSDFSHEEIEECLWATGIHKDDADFIMSSLRGLGG